MSPRQPRKVAGLALATLVSMPMVTAAGLSTACGFSLRPELLEADRFLARPLGSVSTPEAVAARCADAAFIAHELRYRPRTRHSVRTIQDRDVREALSALADRLASEMDLAEQNPSTRAAAKACQLQIPALRAGG